MRLKMLHSLGGDEAAIQDGFDQGATSKGGAGREDFASAVVCYERLKSGMRLRSFRGVEVSKHQCAAGFEKRPDKVPGALAIGAGVKVSGDDAEGGSGWGRKISAQTSSQSGEAGSTTSAYGKEP